jgi:type VI secretion system FHA domain protein
MILTLEVLGDQAKDLGVASRKVFDSIGGTIGRLPDNDWIFPDPYVSGRHALIRYLNGKFFIEDTSTNGVFVNSPDNRISRAQPYQLKDGDELYIDSYRIRVSIRKPTAADSHQDPFEFLKAVSREEREDRTAAMHSQAPEDRNRTSQLSRSSADSATEWLDEKEAVEKAPTVVSVPAHVKLPSAPAAKRTPPVAAQPGSQVPRGSNAPVQGGTREVDLLRELMDAAGIVGPAPSVELARTLGEVLRVTVDGLMEALRARERMKDDMRLRGTTFKPQDNNPLKFSANVDDAFHNMLVKHNTAYLPPPDAFEDALRDVRDHQAALAAAMRVAFEAMFERFDPDRLQEEFDRQMKKGSILGVPSKLRYWDLYREKYLESMKNIDASFRTLFGDKFAKAYEEHLARLQALGKKRGK